MKRAVIAALLIILTFAASAAELFYIGNKADGYIERIESIDLCMRRDDFSAALKRSRRLSDDWEKTAGNVDILLIHDYVDGVGLSISQMTTHIENGNPDMYFAESTSAKKGLASIKRSEYPDFENIF